MHQLVFVTGWKPLNYMFQTRTNTGENVSVRFSFFFPH